MKKLILITLMFLFLIPILSKAQKPSFKNTKLIKFDFQDKKFKGFFKLDDIIEGQFYQLHISHINSNIYTISINTQDTILESQLQFPTFESISFANLSDLISKSVKSADITETTKKPSIPATTLTPEIAKYCKEAKNFLNDKLLRANSLLLRIDNIVFEVKKIVLYTKKEFQENSPDFNFDDKVKEIDNLRNEVNLLRDSIITEKNNFDNLINNYGSPLSEPDKKLIEEVKGFFVQTSSKVSEMYSSINAENSFKLLLNVIAAENNKKYEYTSMPFRLSGDRASLEINITPRDSNSLHLQSYKTVLEFPNRRLNKFTIGSAFYFSPFKNIKTYSTINSGSSSFKISEQVYRNEMGFLATFNYFPFN